MDWQRIETLVERYWEGETSLEEEAELRQALNGAEVPEYLHAEAAMMGLWKQEGEVALSAEADERMRSISRAPRSRWLRMDSMWLRIAATVVIAVGLFFWNREATEPRSAIDHLVAMDHESSPEATYEEVRHALLFISSKFRQGAEPMQNLEELNHAQEPIEKLKAFNRAEEVIHKNTGK